MSNQLPHNYYCQSRELLLYAHRRSLLGQCSVCARAFSREHFPIPRAVIEMGINLAPMPLLLHCAYYIQCDVLTYAWHVLWFLTTCSPSGDEGRRLLGGERFVARPRSDFQLNYQIIHDCRDGLFMGKISNKITIYSRIGSTASAKQMLSRSSSHQINRIMPPPPPWRVRSSSTTEHNRVVAEAYRRASSSGAVKWPSTENRNRPRAAAV